MPVPNHNSDWTDAWTLFPGDVATVTANGPFTAVFMRTFWCRFEQALIIWVRVWSSDEGIPPPTNRWYQ